METYLKLLCLCVFHLLQEQEHKNIYVKISSKILGFPTHLFQKTKLRSAISSTFMSSLHLRHVFSLILVVGPNGHNLNPFNLFYFSLENKMCLFWASKTNDQCVFQLKASKLCFSINCRQTKSYAFHFQNFFLPFSS